MTDFPADFASLPSQLGARVARIDGAVECWIDAIDEVRVHDHVRAASVIMLIDAGAGWVAEAHADDDWTFTVDIGMRRSTRPHPQRIDGFPELTRAGRTMSIDMPITADGALWASGTSTFIRLPLRDGDPPRPVFPDDHAADWPDATAPLDELLAARPTETGLAVDLRPELLNPAMILQGGVAALIAELAAERMLQPAHATPIIATAFDIRYVSMGRVGPIEAVVEPLDSLQAVVRLIDRGRDDAVVTHNLLSFTPLTDQ